MVNIAFKIFVIIIIIVTFNFLNVQSEKLKEPEYSNLDNLLSNIGINVQVDPILLYKNFCSFPGLTCITTTDTSLLTIDLTGKVTLSLLRSSFNFPSLNSLSLTTFGLEDEFLTGPFPSSLKTLKLKFCTTFKIRPIYSSISYLEIDIGRVFDIDIPFSYLTNLDKFNILDSTNLFSNSKIQIVNDLPPVLKTFTTLQLTSSNIPSMANINVLEGVTVNFIGTELDATSIANIATYKDFTCTVIFFGNNINIDFTFPPFKSKYLRSNFNFKKPNNYIDLTQWSTTTIIFENIGPYFNIDGNIPFSKFPSSSLQIYNKGNLTKLPDFPSLLSDTTKNIQRIDLSLNNIPTITNKWMKLNGKLDALTIANNEMTGTVDSSFCELKLNVNQNKLTGDIPSCFTCYFQYDTTLFNWFANNSFNNYQPSIPCETIIPNLYYENIAGRLWLFGNDLGFGYGNLIVTSPIVITNWILAVNSNKYYVDIPMTSLTTNLLNFTFKAANGGASKVYTVAIQQDTPIINLIQPIYSTVSNQLLISGENFSYNTSVIQVYFNDLLEDNICTVTKSTFNEIICSIKSKGGSVFTSANQKVTVSVSVNDVKAENLGACKSLCNLEGICNVNKGTNNEGTCECNADITCNGNGICNGIGNGANCICSDGFAGKGCFYQPHFVSSIEPVSVKGGDVYLKGFFSNYHLDLSVSIGSKPCMVLYAGLDFIKCTIGPGSGVQPIIVMQNGIKWYDDKLFQYLNDPTIPLSCSNGCTSSTNGECNTLTGICNCKNGWSGFDCSLKDSPTQPNTTVNIITGTTKFNSDLINFDISLYQLLEVDINDNIINSFSLENNWFANVTNIDGGSGDKFNKIYLFNQSLQINQSNIIYKLEEIPNDKEYEFAGVQFKIKSGSIKTSVSIYNYKFNNSLTTLKLSFKSSVSNIGNEETCNNELSSNTEIENISSNQNLNYLSIKKGGKILSSRFINRVLSDGSSTFITTTIIKNETDSNQVTVILNLPHCSTCVIDPDYSILVSPDFKENCNDNGNNRKWVIPVAVVVSVVGASTIIIVGFLIYKKYNVSIKVGVAQLKQLNK